MTRQVDCRWCGAPHLMPVCAKTPKQMGRHFRCSDNYFDTTSMGSARCRRLRGADPLPDWAMQQHRPRRYNTTAQGGTPAVAPAAPNPQNNRNTQTTHRQPISRRVFAINGTDNTWFTLTTYSDGSTRTTVPGRLPPLPLSQLPPPLLPPPQQQILTPHDDITDSSTSVPTPPVSPQQQVTNPDTDQAHISAWSVNPNITRVDALPDEISLGDVCL